LQKRLGDSTTPELSDAKAVVTGYSGQPLRALGEAITLLKREYGTYKQIAKEVGPCAVTIGRYHRLSRLPDGLRWKIEQRELALSLAHQVCKLKDENDQWVLAFAILDAPEDGRLTERECRQAVEEVQNTGRPMREVLAERLGLDFKKSVVVVLSFDYWFRFKLCRAAWNRGQSGADLAREIVAEWLAGRQFSSTADLQHISQQLADIAKHVEELAERIEELAE